ncbi:MAG: hypothetical protein IT371_13260 [Deltaproteobacteria bacterium]|nr:hypothetical protein [Deltaproteobacteria bacterium]
MLAELERQGLLGIPNQIAFVVTEGVPSCGQPRACVPVEANGSSVMRQVNVLPSAGRGY